MAENSSLIKRFLLPAALALPILTLAWVTIGNLHILLNGRTYRFPISGYDPRDLLSGHYITYVIDYKVAMCTELYENETGYEACLCLTSPGPEPEGYAGRCETMPLSECVSIIRGGCNYNNFETGLEKYFVPESRALEFEKMTWEGNANILVSVGSNGESRVKDFIPPIPYIDAGKAIPPDRPHP